MVDTLGLILGVLVTGAQVSEAEGAKQLFRRVQAENTAVARLELVWCDGGFEHRIEAWTAAHCPWRVEITKRPDGVKGWVLVPKRWVVEIV